MKVLREDGPGAAAVILAFGTDPGVIDDLFVRRQEVAIQPSAVGVVARSTAMGFPAALSIGHFGIFSRLFVQRVCPGYIVIDRVFASGLVRGYEWDGVTD
ncbi:hypothetical protein ASE33_20350 [Pseudomonas sp. Root9]|nr:hypothetical protein ASE33_20350 [Pseudomonas sp. Root9]